MRSNSDTSISSLVGFKTCFPSISPTRTDATGPSNGTGDNNNAAEAPIAAIVSGLFMPSLDSVVNIICNSFL